MIRNSNYSNDRNSQENYNNNDKYSETGESEFSRESTIPYDQDEVLSERHYNLSAVEDLGKRFIRRREERIPENKTPVSYRGRGPKGYRRTDDMIKEDVSEALYRSSEVDASYIEVFVKDGHVTLKGTVDSRNQKKLAERTIENLAGVDDVYNELRIREESSLKPGKHGLMDNITGMN